MTSNLARKVRILRDYYRENGFLKFCRYALVNSLFIYQKYTVFERDLSEPIEEAQAKIPINVRLLSRNGYDIDRLVEFWPDVYAYAKHAYTDGTFANIKQMINTRLSMSEECMIAEYKGKIIHMNWIGFQNTHLFNSYVLERGISSEEALSYNVFCAPKFRDNKVMEAVFVEIFKSLKGKGHKKVIEYVESRNTASAKGADRVFKKKIGNLYYIGLLGFGKYIFKEGSTPQDTPI